MPNNVIPITKPPQVEDGYTRLANTLLDAMIAAGFSSRQWAVVMAIVRKTYGYNKKSDDIGLGQLQALTGIDKAHLSRTVRELADLKVIDRQVGIHGHTLSINKHFGEWGLLKEQRLPNQQPVAERATRRVAEKATPPVADSATTKDNSSKDNYQKTKESPAPQAAGDHSTGARVAKPKGKVAMTAELQARFERFYAAYPRKTDRLDAERAFAKLAPSEELLSQMLDALARMKAAGMFADRKYTKHPATWLNKGCWLDEVDGGYAPVEAEVIEAYNDALGGTLGTIDATVYSQSRAGHIQDFLTLSPKEGFWKAFFPWVRDNCQLPPGTGFDYLISREGFTKVKGGQHQVKA